MLFARDLAAVALAAFALAPLAATAQTVLPLSVNGGWQSFDVDDFAALDGGTGWIDNTSGESLSFTFTLAGPATLRVVDAGFAGDTFSLVVDGQAYASSAVPTVIYDNELQALLDFDAAWADARYSRFEVTLGAGTHTLGGALLQSVLLPSGAPLNATIGAVSLVPEPATVATLMTGLLLLGAVLRRRQDKR